MKRFAHLIPAAALVFTVACGRTDAGITTDIKTRLAADDTVKAYEVDVDTKDHVVTLSGTVETTAAKDQAILIARQADGVRDVVDNLRVVETAATSGVGGVGADSKVDDASKSKIREGADTVAEGAKDVGKGVKKGAEEVAKGAKKAGSTVKDAVTDKDRDTDKDGK